MKHIISGRITKRLFILGRIIIIVLSLGLIFSLKNASKKEGEMNSLSLNIPKFEDVLFLEKEMDKFKTGVSNFNFPEDSLTLGHLQFYYSNFKKSISNAPISGNQGIQMNEMYVLEKEVDKWRENRLNNAPTTGILYFEL